MTCKFEHTWILLVFVANVLIPVQVQFPIPMAMCPPMFPAPPPMPVPVPVPVAMCPITIPGNRGNNIHSPKMTTTTTTTTKKPETIGIAIPMPVPMPMPIPMAVPMPMGVPAMPPPNSCQQPSSGPNNCPPCPPCICSPSCTPPAFSYCSPCHLRCRCRRKEDVPEPLPNRPPRGPVYGMPVMPVMPPPVVVVPYPPPIPVRKPRKERKTKYSSCSEESTDTSSSESDYQRIHRYKKRRRPIYRRSLRSSDSENELVQPMLSYVAENGDIKFKTKISSDDVAELLGEKEDFKRNNYQEVPILTNEYEKIKPNAIVITNNDKKQNRERYKKVLLREGVSNHILGGGKKELVFRPSGDKKISNLTVSFQIS